MTAMLDGHSPDLMGTTMSKTNDTSKLLTDTELDAVTGGASDLGKNITKAVDDAISSPSGAPEVWVGCGWVPQWW
jgi:hypothetical protein